jgi:hypothetical protein
VRTNADFAAGVGTNLGTIRRAFDAALKAEPPASRARGQAVSAMLAVYSRAPSEMIRKALVADLEAFEQARTER